MIRNLIAVIFCIFLYACNFTNTENTYPLHFSDAIMGTSYTIKVSSIPGSLNKDELTFQIKGLLNRLDEQMSTYRLDSELSKFNSSQSNEWEPISSSLFEVLNEAKKIYEISEGAFDITVGSLVNLWGFGSIPMSYKVPVNELIQEELKKTGSNFLQLDEETLHIKKDISSLYLDLSAIAKGYAVDQVGALLEKNGILNYMVEIGGELRLRGTNATHKPWRIAIEKPASETRIIQKVLPLSNISLATSGDYRNYFEVDNVRFSHTIDPRTGRPITHKLASVTILSDTTMKADAFATAFMVLGLEHGYKMAEEQNIAALFIVKTKEGFLERASTAFVEKFE